MKMMNIVVLALCLASLTALAVCIFTDWNDALTLPLSLLLSAAGNLLHFLSGRRRP